MDLEVIAKAVITEYQMTFEGAPLDFAMDVARRAVLAEREACAKVCSKISRQHAWDRRSADLAQACHDEIRARSNVEGNRPPRDGGSQD